MAVAPIGFVSDHLEVVWDLDNEAREYAQEHDIELARAATPGADERFARLAVDLITEVVEGRPALRPAGEPGPGVRIQCERRIVLAPVLRCAGGLARGPDNGAGRGHPCFTHHQDQRPQSVRHRTIVECAGQLHDLGRGRGDGLHLVGRVEDSNRAVWRVVRQAMPA